MFAKQKIYLIKALNITPPPRDRQDLKPNYCNDRNNLETHINWLLFDEAPINASIPEISYPAATKYFLAMNGNPNMQIARINAWLNS